MPMPQFGHEAPGAAIHTLPRYHTHMVKYTREPPFNLTHIIKLAYDVAGLYYCLLTSGNLLLIPVIHTYSLRWSKRRPIPPSS